MKVSSRQENTSSCVVRYPVSGRQAKRGKTPIKVCTCCKKALALTEFYKRRGGLHSKCRSCINKYQRNWRKENSRLYSSYSSKYNRQNKEKVLRHYGMRCACCGEGLCEGLTIDHINGDGAAHRRSLGVNRRGGSMFYSWLIKNNFPPGFQTLCGTCNLAKGTKKFCPHQSISGYKRKETNEIQDPYQRVFGISSHGLHPSNPDDLRRP